MRKRHAFRLVGHLGVLFVLAVSLLLGAAGCGPSTPRPAAPTATPAPTDAMLPRATPSPTRPAGGGGTTPTVVPPTAVPAVRRPADGYVFAALDQAGVARYDGLAWTLVNSGLPPEVTVHQLAVDPFDPTTLLAATTNGVYRTTDALGSCLWRQTVVTPTRSIAAHPSRPGEFYAGTCTGLGRFVKSTDGGATWSTRSLTSTGRRSTDDCPSAIVVGKRSGDALYVLNANTGSGHTFWKSTDGGESFSLGSNWIPPSGDDTYTAGAVEPDSDDVLYMSDEGGFGGDVIRSEDGGLSWTYVRTWRSGSFPDVVVSPYDRSVWTAGLADRTDGNSRMLLWSTDRGGSWTTSPVLDARPYCVDMGAPGTIWAGGDNGYTWANTAGGDGPWTPSRVPERPDGTYPRVNDIVPLAGFYYTLVSPAISLVEVAPLQLPADGVATAVITVTVLGAQGQPVPGVTVVLADDGTGTTLTLPLAPTDAEGQAFGTIRGVRSEVVHVRAWAAGAELSSGGTVTFVGPGLAEVTGGAPALKGRGRHSLAAGLAPAP